MPSKSQLFQYSGSGKIGFDLPAGSYNNAEDGFTCYIHAKDIRIATEDYQNNPINLLFTALHEGGHEIFDQNVDIALDDTNLYRGAMTIHESQSRLWKNIVGRRKAFWIPCMEKAFEMLGCYPTADIDTFYLTINRVKPSSIRVDADELTYNLHIIARYECEKAIFNENVNTKDLRKLWTTMRRQKKESPYCVNGSTRIFISKVRRKNSLPDEKYLRQRYRSHQLPPIHGRKIQRYLLIFLWQ